jgi:hypothetical protein
MAAANSVRKEECNNLDQIYRQDFSIISTGTIFYVVFLLGLVNLTRDVTGLATMNIRRS